MKTISNNTATMMPQFCKQVVTATALALVLFAAVPVQAENPVHLDWADEIAQNVLPENNLYATSPNYIRWTGINGALQYENRTQCSSLITRVLQQAYHWTDSYFKDWLGSTGPSAAIYHDQIIANNGFDAYSNINDIVPGDILAIKYPSGLSSTGHVMLVRSAPVARTASAPLVSDTIQYEVEIIDSSQSGHGPYDSRLMPDNSWDTGVGIGIFRIYADQYSGEIVGYTWSTYSNSTFYSQAERHMVVGRLQ